MCNKFWCSVFIKDTQPFDFVKRNKIWKLVDEVKYVAMDPLVLGLTGPTSQK